MICLPHTCRVFILLSTVLLGACTVPAYVHEAGQFNRSSKNFGQDPVDLENVTICYNSMDSRPADVVKLAIDTCGKFGKTAHFERQSYLICPLAAPIAAEYACM